MSTAQVCDRCRQKKIKCHGASDKCLPCANANVDCTTLMRLERKRKRQVQQIPQDENLRSPQQETSPMSDTAVPSSLAKLPSQSVVEMGLRNDESVRPATAKSVEKSVDEPVIGHMGRLVPGLNDVDFFAGSSTGVHFISQTEQQRQSLFNSSEGLNNEIYSLYLHNPDQSQGSGLALSTYELIVSQLPSDIEALLGETIDEWTPVYPIWHRSTTISRAGQILRRQVRATTPELYLLLALLSLAACSKSVNGSSHPSAHDQVAEQMYSLSTSLFFQLLAHPHITTLQGLATMQIYLQLRRQHTLALQLSGMATRLAQSLGLHRHSRRFKFNPLETEMRKRVWWCVYTQDVFITAYHGLPRLLRGQDIDTDMPFAINHDQLSRDTLHFPLPGESSEIDSALSLFSLSRILATTFEILYTTTRRRGGVQKIQRLQADLDTWERNSELSTAQASSFMDDDENVNPSPASPKFPTFFLHAVHSLVTIHIHRPALTFPPSHPQFQESLRRTVAASSSLITLIRAHHTQALLTLYPSGLHMLWQAGSNLLFGQWHNVSTSLTSVEIQDLVRSAASLIRDTSPGDAFLEKCASALEELLQQTFSPTLQEQNLTSLDGWDAWTWDAPSALDMANDLAAFPAQFTQTGETGFSDDWFI